MTSVQLAAARAANEGWDSDGSLSWEDFFGTSTDLAPGLLGMYDALIGRPAHAAELSAAVARSGCPAQQRKDAPAHRLMEVIVSDVVARPLSVSSIASSSSSSSGTSSCSGTGGGRLGAAPKSSAYLASIESLEDDDSDEEVNERERQKPGGRAERLKGSTGSQGSGDSGVGSPCSYISSPSPPQGRPRYCDPHLSYMDRVVMEIVETEGVYVKDLEQVIQGYLEKWRASLDPSIGERHLSDLFSNIEQIYQFNSGFLEQLEQCGLDPVKVASCFVNNNSGFAVYTQYCTNYPRTVSVLTELMRQEATVRLFRERQSSLQHTLPLGSYLLKPVQRILKYHLLLQNLVKHYVCEADGYSDIVEALSAMTGIAHHINNMKRRHEHSVRVQEIQSLLYGWEGEDLTTYGELCAEGAFRLSGAKAPRHAFLFDKMLLITKKKEEANLGYKAHIMCSNLMLIESVPGEPLSFHVIPFDNPRLQYTLQARNLEQKREWTLQLKRVILENYNAVIPSHARQLVMQLGQNRTDDDVLAEKGTPKRQHSAPEYLEKRKQERDRRKSETGLRYRLRRSRKSEGGSLESPLTHHRGRRASSNSHDRSPSREGLRSQSPITVKDRFGSWRRKSEPGCYSPPLLGKKRQLAPLSVAQDCEPVTAESETELIEEISQHGSQEHLAVEPETIDCEITVENPPMKDQGEEEKTEEHKKEEEEAKTLEEIVGQLLMQNHEFQKILKKQQRHVGLRHRNAQREETTDTENEEEGVYETLTMSTTSTPGSRPSSASSYRAHRHAHMRTLRNQQKTFTAATAGLTKYQRRIVQNAEAQSLDGDYVTLMCHPENSDKDSPDNTNTSRIKCNLESRDDVKVNNVQSVDPLRGDKGRMGSFRSVSESRISQIWRHGEVKTSNESKCVVSAEPKSVQNDGFGNYDNLQNIWESVKKQQEEIQKLADKTETSENLANQRLSLSIPDEGRGLANMANIPTSPAVWLKQQSQHLATTSKKSGSLPRSFQLSHDSEQNLASKDIASFRTKRYDRPFTIASDKPAEINFDDIERYIEQSDTCHVRHRFPLNDDTTEEDSMTEYTATPNASMNELNIHPEYKIYRPTVSRATLKQVLSSVRHGGTRASSETLDDERERRASRFVYALARQYGKTLKQRIRHIMGDTADDCSDSHRTPSPVQTLPSPNLPTYKQGSSGLGARIAQSEYANPRLLYPNIQTKAIGNLRPDSVLSVSSHFTSSSEGEKTCFDGTQDASTNGSQKTVVSKPSEEHLSDGSADSYYERSLDTLEKLLETDPFRDSAVFSDHEDGMDSVIPIGSQSLFQNYPIELKSSVMSKSSKVPPPVPAKPDALRRMKLNKTNVESKVKIHQKEEHLVRGLEGISKSIRDRRRELEQWRAGKERSTVDEEGDTSSQHSAASTVIEVGAEEERGTPRGWVRHVIGKLQRTPSEDQGHQCCKTDTIVH